MENFKEWNQTCLRKKKLKEAWADEIIEKSGNMLRKYYCPHCFGWHVTKKK